MGAEWANNKDFPAMLKTLGKLPSYEAVAQQLTKKWEAEVPTTKDELNKFFNVQVKAKLDSHQILQGSRGKFTQNFLFQTLSDAKDYLCKKLEFEESVELMTPQEMTEEVNTWAGKRTSQK